MQVKASKMLLALCSRLACSLESEAQGTIRMTTETSLRSKHYEQQAMGRKAESDSQGLRLDPQRPVTVREGFMRAPP